MKKTCKNFVKMFKVRFTLVPFILLFEHETHRFKVSAKGANVVTIQLFILDFKDKKNYILHQH